jgi:hypothetical protein
MKLVSTDLWQGKLVFMEGLLELMTNSKPMTSRLPHTTPAGDRDAA